jgi:hypothetical protein
MSLMRCPFPQPLYGQIETATAGHRTQGIRPLVECRSGYSASVGAEAHCHEGASAIAIIAAYATSVLCRDARGSLQPEKVAEEEVLTLGDGARDARLHVKHEEAALPDVRDLRPVG